MHFLSNDIGNFIYIAVIILGGIVMTLSLILYAKEKSGRNRAMFIFMAAVFVFMILDFITYYGLGVNLSGKAIFAMITTSDVFFSVMIIAWLYLLIVFAGAEEKFRIRWVIMVTIVYDIVSQVLSVKLGRFDSYSLQIDGGIGKVALQAVNTAYTCFTIAIAIGCILWLFRKYRSGFMRNVNLVLEITFIGYMVWVAYWDYSTWYKTEENLLDIYAFDPLILLYAVISLALVYYFYKKDPLKLAGAQIGQEKALAIVAGEYGLSERETEVMSLVNRGLSNGQIAAELSISENTVKRHTSNIFKKTDTQSRHELVYKISSVNTEGMQKK